jgi:hypothetical protein
LPLVLLFGLFLFFFMPLVAGALASNMGTCLFLDSFGRQMAVQQQASWAKKSALTLHQLITDEKQKTSCQDNWPSGMGHKNLSPEFFK